MKTISIIINCDTRNGVEAEVTKIGDFGSGSLQGCRSWDFLNDGVINKLKFFEAHIFPIKYLLEPIICIDEHRPDAPTGDSITTFELGGSGDSKTFCTGRVISRPANRTRPHWNDWIYLDALRYATGDYVVHFDGDVAAFKRPGFDLMGQMMTWLSGGFKYVCQPTQVADHGMLHASTRFFMCERQTLDLDEIGKCVDDPAYRISKYGDRHCPCLEHILGLLATDGGVLYPPAANDDWTVFSWVQYHAGTLAKLNAMDYDGVKDYVFNKCGGLHGASDLIGVPI